MQQRKGRPKGNVKMARKIKHMRQHRSVSFTIYAQMICIGATLTVTTVGCCVWWWCPPPPPPACSGYAGCSGGIAAMRNNNNKYSILMNERPHSPTGLLAPPEAEVSACAWDDDGGGAITGIIVELESGTKIRKEELESSTPFPQVGIKQAYVPAASSPQLAYKVSFHSPVLTVFGYECDRLPTVPKSYRNPHRFLTIPQVGIKHFPQVAIKLDSNLWELLDSKLTPDTRAMTTHVS
ncbi:hypothetical protein PRIPAC_89732, partial [Pristionchus pacificus]|uniref:Uncharacterized protein n=1 Tax=Pristionchus pacificus TaxID=54126 RepID=A0A2A6CWP2_PRIPA